LRIGCVRRRRSRRGVGGWPCLLLLGVSLSRSRLLRRDELSLAGGICLGTAAGCRVGVDFFVHVSRRERLW